MGKGSQKVNIPMAAALILLSLTMISIHWSSGLYARYSSSTTYSDSARVARFQVSGTAGEDITVKCRDQEPGKYAITIESKSEVAVEYALKVVFEEAISAEDLEVKLDDQEGAWSDDRKTLTYSNLGTMEPNADPRTHDLSFKVLDWTYVTAGADNTPEVQKDLNFTVHLTVEQID